MSIHAQANALLHRISAACLRLELIAEAIGPASADVREMLSSLSSELTDCARAGKEIAAEARQHFRRESPTDVDSIVQETMAPLARYLERRETSLLVEIDPASAIAIDPAALRAGLASVVQAVLRRAGSTSRLAIRGSAGRIEVTVSPAGSLEQEEVARELEEVASLLEMLGGRLEVVRAGGDLSVEIRAKQEEP